MTDPWSVRQTIDIFQTKNEGFLYFQHHYIQPDSRFTTIAVDGVSDINIEHHDDKVEILFESLEKEQATTSSFVIQDELRGKLLTAAPDLSFIELKIEAFH